MGNRANFVLVDGSGWRLHYSHWAANRVCSALVAGPEAATRFMMAQRSCEDRERDWLDDCWAEGGAVVDHLARRLVFYGDELMLEVPSKRVFMRLLALTWPGWDIRWAYDGIGDLAAHVGVDRAVVRAADEDERSLPGELEDDPEWPCHLLTVRDAAGGLTAYPFWSDCHTAWQGPGLLERLPAEGVARLDLSVLPESGLHVDVRTHTAGAWLTGSGTGLVPALAELWPGWRVDFWEDRYEEQMRRCSGAVTFPPVDLVAALDDLIASLERGLGHDPVPAMLELVRERTAGTEQRIELNPLFTAHKQVDPTPTEWSAVLRAAAELRIRLDGGHPTFPGTTEP